MDDIHRTNPEILRRPGNIDNNNNNNNNSSSNNNNNNNNNDDDDDNDNDDNHDNKKRPIKKEPSKKSKGVKYDNNYNFNKFKQDRFEGATLIKSKFDHLDKFYDEFFRLFSLGTKRKADLKKDVLDNAKNIFNKQLKEYIELYNKSNDADKNKYNPNKF